MAALKNLPNVRATATRGPTNRSAVQLLTPVRYHRKAIRGLELVTHKINSSPNRHIKAERRNLDQTTLIYGIMCMAFHVHVR